MDDCCSASGAAPRRTGVGDERYDAVFDERFARRVARHYARRGLAAPERRIVAYLVDEVGVEGARVLEIGGGVGELQLALLERGAASTVNLELSAAYEKTAHRLLAEAGVAGRVTRTVGVDIAEHPNAVGPADIVVLHRVVCCYPDAERLLSAAADLATSALVFSHPPRSVMSRAAAGWVNLVMRLLGRGYRGFVHSPDAMVGVVSAHGLHASYRHQDRVWCIVGARR
ncbi:class I SAM-dependent methyltransferase [Agromyces italicus]|uniref:class I SAM-dependent methyltransferase n=1 Tax=Agromyces italicus TaxID=279572 RepID=UPI0003B71320|nr:methyltransferase domain-containing protein [Agromyces italicus]